MTKIYHLNDRTLKYKILKQCKRIHQYLELPGEFESRYPQEIVFPNMDDGRVDEYYSTKEGLLVNLEEESGDIGEKTLKKFGKYAIFGDYMYGKKVFSAVITQKNPKKDYEYFRRSPSIYIKVHYFHLTQNELWVKYENVINKVQQKEELTDTEALDIAFIGKFISKKSKSFVITSLSKIFKYAIIPDEELKRDVGVLLGAMITEHVKKSKQNELMEEINMKQIENEIKILARDEFGEELRKMEKENFKLQQENMKIKQETDKVKKEINKFKEGIKKLSEMKDFDKEEVQKIINSLIVLQ